VYHIDKIKDNKYLNELPKKKSTFN